MEGNNSLLTPEQVAGMLQLHVLTIYNYIRQGKLNAVQLGRNYRVVPEDLTHFIESNRTKNHRTMGRNIRRA